MTVAIPVVLEVHTSGDQVLAPELNLSCEPGATMVQLLDATYDELRRAGIDDPLYAGSRTSAVSGSPGLRVTLSVPRGHTLVSALTSTGTGLGISAKSRCRT